MNGRKRSRTCAYCGEPATTKDHVPPRGLFLDPPPPNLITVPACFRCNNSASTDDELFRIVVSIGAGVDTPESRTLWDERVLPGLRKNRRVAEDLRGSMRRVPVHTPSGAHLGNATAVQLDAPSHDRTIGRITRGLYYHHFGVPLGMAVPVEPTLLASGSEWPEELKPILNRMVVKSFGEPIVFEYTLGRADDRSDTSIWLYQFYGRYRAMARTGSL